MGGQRHWINLASPPFIDAKIDIGLRTRRRVSAAAKVQPEWIDALFEQPSNKNASVELQVSPAFPYRTCEAMEASPGVVDHVAVARSARKL